MCPSETGPVLWWDGLGPGTEPEQVIATEPTPTTTPKPTPTHLLLQLDVIGRQVDVDGVFVVDDSAHSSHGGVEQSLLFVQRSLFLSVRKRTGVRQEVDL